MNIRFNFLAKLLCRRTSLLPHWLTYYSAQPPVVTLEFEMRLRACRREALLHPIFRDSSTTSSA